MVRLLNLAVGASVDRLDSFWFSSPVDCVWTTEFHLHACVQIGSDCGFSGVMQVQVQQSGILVDCRCQWPTEFHRHARVQIGSGGGLSGVMQVQVQVDCRCQWPHRDACVQIGSDCEFTII